jgi:hypothetical protein
MRVSGNPLTTQIAYLRALRDLMENTGDIPENLSVERIKKHLSDLRLNNYSLDYSCLFILAYLLFDVT